MRRISTLLQPGRNGTVHSGQLIVGSSVQYLQISVIAERNRARWDAQVEDAIARAGEYADVPGFCKSATLDEVRKHGHVLTPGRYVGAEAAEEDAEPFEEKMRRLTTTLGEQFSESARLEKEIRANLRSVGYHVGEE